MLGLASKAISRHHWSRIETIQLRRLAKTTANDLDLTNCDRAKLMAFYSDLNSLKTGVQESVRHFVESEKAFEDHSSDTVERV